MYAMTIPTDTDSSPKNPGKSLSFGFESTDAAMLAGIRVRPADLARLLGVTKSAVSTWVKDGRVILGVDGRVDPRDAINRLLSTGDPARLRAFFLKPLVTELTAARQRLAALENELAIARDDSEFHESSAAGMLELFHALGANLDLEWSELRKLPAEQGLAALLSWLNISLEHGVEPGSLIVDMAAHGEEEEGEESQSDEEGGRENA